MRIAYSLNQVVYDKLIEFRDLKNYWNLLIKSQERIWNETSILRKLYDKRNSELRSMIEWFEENTNINLDFLDQTILEYELKILDENNFNYNIEKPKPKPKPKPKRKLSLKAKLKNADKKATIRMKKWLKQPQAANWWVDRFIISHTHTGKPSIIVDDRYKLYFSCKMPECIESIGKYSIRYSVEYANYEKYYY